MLDIITWFENNCDWFFNGIGVYIVTIAVAGICLVAGWIMKLKHVYTVRNIFSFME